MDLQALIAAIYGVSVVPVAASSLTLLILAVASLRRGARPPRETRAVADSELPFVSVVVPVFDDPVAVRCIEACLAFDYPEDRIEIAVLDDSVSIATRQRIAELVARHPERVRYRHRAHREGYKPGALVAADADLRGELLAIFDADFVPAPRVLRELVAPFRDPRVAIVQGRQGFLGEDQSLVARFAAALLSVHHHVTLPAASWLGLVFFCGTAGVLRRSAIEDAGGWNTKSITEDADLSVRMLARGWEAVYLPIEVPGEVPANLRAFLRQQMRWCFGGVRVFVDHGATLLRSPALGVSQRALLAYLTLGNLVAIPVATMTGCGLASWALCLAGGTVSALDGRAGIASTVAFLLVTALALHRRRRLRELPWVLLGTATIAIALAFANGVASLRALVSAQRPLYRGATSWICTPKSGNRLYDAA